MPFGSRLALTLTPLSLSRPLSAYTAHLLSECLLSYSTAEDWDKLMSYRKSNLQLFVNVIQVTSRGYKVRFRSVRGFLPFNQLATSMKCPTFDSWMEVNKPLWAKAKLQNKDFSNLYEMEIKAFLESFDAKYLKVRVLAANQSTERLVFTMKPKKELLATKRLMKTLSVGDFVKCVITSKSPEIGYFCELPGRVSALIKHSRIPLGQELKPGTLIEARVHELNFSRLKIFLSL